MVSKIEFDNNKNIEEKKIHINKSSKPETIYNSIIESYKKFVDKKMIIHNIVSNKKV